MIVNDIKRVTLWSNDFVPGLKSNFDDSSIGFSILGSASSDCICSISEFRSISSV